MSVDFVFRFLGAIVGAIAGWQGGEALVAGDEATALRYVLLISVTGSALGALVAPYVTTVPFRLVRRLIRELPALDLVATTIGIIVGAMIAALLALPLSKLPGALGGWLPFANALFFVCLGVAVMALRKGDILQLLSQRVTDLAPGSGGRGRRVIVDTSAIIDGRIADVLHTGFLGGDLVVPRFVLTEMQHIADSPDAQRRTRGRRGLEMLSKMQKEALVPIEITEIDFENVAEVDAKLVRLAKILGCPIITTDYNLNRVAELLGVPVLNLNELANAVKPVVIPGEELAVRIVQEGKEVGQGVGFLDDGTMVVVEGGRRFLNHAVEVNVTRVLQTVAGRMIFAHPKGSSAR